MSLIPMTEEDLKSLESVLESLNSDEWAVDVALALIFEVRRLRAEKERILRTFSDAAREAGLDLVVECQPRKEGAL